MKLHEITIIEEASRCLMCYDPPCSKACPSSSDPASFIKAIRFENLKGGARKTLENNILGDICANTCPSSKYCEGACIRGRIDRPVNIKMLHGYITAIVENYDITLNKKKPVKFKAAVLGTDMAGVAAAAELAKSGAEVTIFSDAAVLKTQLQVQYAVEKEDLSILDVCFKNIKALGIEFLPYKSGLNLSEYDAVLLTSKKSLNEMPSIDSLPHVFFTGELAAGPDDAAFSVKKGKQSAKSMIKYLERGG